MENERKAIEMRVNLVEKHKAGKKSEKEKEKKIAKYKEFILFCVNHDFGKISYASVRAFIVDIEKERVLALAMHLGHDGLLRSKEILWRNKQSEQGPEVINYSFNNNSADVMYTIPRTKTHRQGPPVTITIPSIGTGINAYKLLILHLVLSDLIGNPTSQLFPAYATTA